MDKWTAKRGIKKEGVCIDTSHDRHPVLKNRVGLFKEHSKEIV